MGVENDAATQELWKQSEGSRKCWKQIKGRSKTGKVTFSWGLITLANERAGRGPWDQSEASGKLESWCFLRREKWVSTSQFVIVAGKYEEGLESWVRSRSSQDAANRDEAHQTTGERKTENHSCELFENLSLDNVLFSRVKSVVGVRCHQG